MSHEQYDAYPCAIPRVVHITSRGIVVAHQIYRLSQRYRPRPVQPRRWSWVPSAATQARHSVGNTAVALGGPSAESLLVEDDHPAPEQRTAEGIDRYEAGAERQADPMPLKVMHRPGGGRFEAHSPSLLEPGDPEQQLTSAPFPSRPAASRWRREPWALRGFRPAASRLRPQHMLTAAIGEAIVKSGTSSVATVTASSSLRVARRTASEANTETHYAAPANACAEKYVRSAACMAAHRAYAILGIPRLRPYMCARFMH